jgi:hypothetical protein
MSPPSPLSTDLKAISPSDKCRPAQPRRVAKSRDDWVAKPCHWAPIPPQEEANIRSRARQIGFRCGDIMDAWLWVRRNINPHPTYQEVAEVAEYTKDETRDTLRKLEGLLTRIDAEGGR